jgi:site-specific recombinase XerD
VFPSVADFLETLEAPRTRAAYTRDLALFEEYCASIRIAPSAGTDSALADFVQSRALAGDASSTLTRRVAAVRSYLRFVGVDTSTVPGPHAPSVARLDDRRTVTFAELRAMLETSQPTSTRLLAVTLAGSGLGLDAVRIVRFDDVRVGNDGGAVLGVGSRHVPLPGLVETLLWELWEGRRGEFVFAGRGDGPVTRQAAAKRIERLGAAAGIDGLTATVLQRSAVLLARTALQARAVGRPQRWAERPAAVHPMHAIVRCLSDPRS